MSGRRRAEKVRFGENPDAPVITYKEETMKKTSKLLAMLLALSLAMTACGGGEKPSESEEPAAQSSEAASSEESSEKAETETPKMTDENTLVVGSPAFNGDLINGFTNSAYDVAIKRLIGTYDGMLSYATYYYNEAGEFNYNPTVCTEEPMRTANDDGSVTFTFKLNPALVWNDGTKITAKDYVFKALYLPSPAWTALGTTNSNAGAEYVGYEAYHKGDSMAFAGVRLLGEDSFSITVSSEYEPYFYETALVACTPAPMHRYAPNLEVVDSEEGAMIQPKEGYTVSEEDRNSLLEGQKKRVEDAKKALEDEKGAKNDDGSSYYDIALFDEIVPKLDAMDEEARKAALAEGKVDGKEIGELGDLYKMYLDVKAEEAKLAEYEANKDSMDPTELLMAESALDVSQTYRFNPDVTCGPYNFVSNENKMIKVTLNDKFIGDVEGKKPTIQNVILQEINTNLAIDLLEAGNIDISPGEIEGEKINKAKEIKDKDGSLDYVFYNRNGYGHLSMVYDQGATQYKGVRQAIAYCLDRQEFVNTICGGYGTVAEGAYGLDMWEWNEKGEELDGKFIHYSLNPDQANAALDTTPYKFEKDGTTPFDPAKAEEAYNADKENFDYWRYDENGKQLVVYHEGSENNSVTDLINTQLPDNAKRCGMQYLINITDFATLLNHYYNPDPSNPQAPTAFNLATSFSIPNDPYYEWHSSQIGNQNICRVSDPDLDVILETMRKADSKDTAKWADGWVKFQLWWNENVPQVPLYSNEYYDIFRSRVKGLDTSAFWEWSDDICDISLEN